MFRKLMISAALSALLLSPVGAASAFAEDEPTDASSGDAGDPGSTTDDGPTMNAGGGEVPEGGEEIPSMGPPDNGEDPQYLEDNPEIYQSNGRPLAETPDEVAPVFKADSSSGSRDHFAPVQKKRKGKRPSLLGSNSTFKDWLEKTF